LFEKIEALFGIYDGQISHRRSQSAEELSDYAWKPAIDRYINLEYVIDFGKREQEHKEKQKEEPGINNDLLYHQYEEA
jgi:hypothetical protein